MIESSQRGRYSVVQTGIGFVQQSSPPTTPFPQSKHPSPNPQHSFSQQTQLPPTTKPSLLLLHLHTRIHLRVAHAVREEVKEQRLARRGVKRHRNADHVVLTLRIERNRLVQVLVQASCHSRYSVRRGRHQNRFRLNAAIQQFNLVLHIQVHLQTHHRFVLFVEQLNARIRSLQLLQNLSGKLAQSRRVIELLVLQITTDNRGKPPLPLRSVVRANRTVLEMEGINCVPERFR